MASHKNSGLPLVTCHLSLVTDFMRRHPLYGLLAEFDNAEDLLAAARRAHEAGYTLLDAFTPFPIEGLADAVGFHKTRVPVVTFIGGLIGCAGGFLLQYYPNVMGYPLNIGGRSTDCRLLIIPSLTCRALRWPLATASSSASKRAIRNSIASGRGSF